MYIVRDKATRNVLHVNPAPVEQQLEGTDIYFRFDPKTMEVAKGELPEVPAHFDIDQHGRMLAWTLERQVKEGLKKLPPELKAVGDRVVPKTTADRVADGSVRLLPTQKLVGDAIVEKTGAERVREGLVKLGPTEVLDGDEIREMTDVEKAEKGLISFDRLVMKSVAGRIVPKTPAELVRDKVLALAPDQKVVGDDVVTPTPRQMLDEGRYDLKSYKEVTKKRCAELELTKRREAVSDNELMYALYQLRDADTLAAYKEILKTSRDRIDKVSRAIEHASAADDVDKAAHAFEAKLGFAGRPGSEIVFGRHGA